MNRPAIFLDRDGVLIENVHTYIREYDQVVVFDQAVEAVKLLSRAGFFLVEVTNQGCVGKGILTLERALEINAWILSEFRIRGASIDAAYLCPHTLAEACLCRKPLPGMLHQAAEEHDLDLSRSFMVGDAITDMQAAQAAGVIPFLVRTGRGAEQESGLVEAGFASDLAHNDLLAVTRKILGLDHP